MTELCFFMLCLIMLRPILVLAAFSSSFFHSRPEITFWPLSALSFFWSISLKHLLRHPRECSYGYSLHLYLRRHYMWNYWDNLMSFWGYESTDHLFTSSRLKIYVSCALVHSLSDRQGEWTWKLDDRGGYWAWLEWRIFVCVFLH